MSKFVVLAREAFTDLVRGLGSKGADIGTNVQAMLRNYQKNRTQTVSRYVKSVGKPVPEGKVVVPKGLYTALKNESGYKGRVQKSAKYLGDESKWESKAKGEPSTRAERLKEKAKSRILDFNDVPSKRGRIVETTRRDDGAPTTIRTMGTREYDDIRRMNRLREERAAAKSGRKLNRTGKVTRRSLEEDTF